MDARLTLNHQHSINVTVNRATLPDELQGIEGYAATFTYDGNETTVYAETEAEVLSVAQAELNRQLTQETDMTEQTSALTTAREAGLLEVGNSTNLTENQAQVLIDINHQGRISEEEAYNEYTKRTIESLLKRELLTLTPDGLILLAATPTKPGTEEEEIEELEEYDDRSEIEKAIDDLDAINEEVEEDDDDTTAPGRSGYDDAIDALRTYILRYADPKIIRRRIRRYCRKHDLPYEFEINTELGTIKFNGDTYRYQ